MKINYLDNQQGTKAISGSKANGRPLNKFLEITDVRKTNIRSLSPPSIQKEVESYIGNGKVTIYLKRS